MEKETHVKKETKDIKYTKKIIDTLPYTEKGVPYC
tara:strand:- start:426 stop:530 length:105 start_codon:yes stop_codon:yes gene_type:complete